MSSITESISRVRELLDYPKESKPQIHRVYGAVIRHLQNRFNELNNTAEAWAYGETTLSAVDGTDTYTVSATAFGKPISVVTYSTDDTHFERPVQMVKMSDIVFDWSVPRNIADGWWSLDGSTHSATRIAFYRDAGTNTVKCVLRPIPQASATYRILYTVGDWTDDVALTSTPLLSEHHHIFEIPAALALLPSCEWGEDGKKDEMKRGMLEKSLLGELGMFEGVWKRAIASQVHDPMNFRFSDFDY